MVALTLTALLAASAPAAAAQLEIAGGGAAGLFPVQQWADASYAPTYPGAVQLELSATLLACGSVTGAVGCTSWSQWPLPDVRIDTGYGPYLTHQYLMHELGHVFDATEMQDSFRAAFMAIWGLPGGASAWWTPFSNHSGSPGEWFAESYKLCALYGPQLPNKAWTTDSPSYDFPGDRSPARQDASCQLVLQVGAAAGLPAPPSPIVYSPRVLMQANRRVVECRGRDLLLAGNHVLCERTGGGSASGPWNVALETRRMGKAAFRRTRRTA